MDHVEVRYVNDCDVDKEMDRQLRELLSLCFPKDEIFKRQRYYSRMPEHRWIIVDEGRIVAHAAAHEKSFATEEGRREPFFGVAEVCVHPDHRRRGWVKAMLRAMEEYFARWKYGMLLGNSKIYTSSGYRRVNNVYFTGEPGGPDPDAMVKVFGAEPWPSGKVVVEGPTF